MMHLQGNDHQVILSLYWQRNLKKSYCKPFKIFLHPRGQGQITSSKLYLSANRMVKLLLEPHSVILGLDP